MKTRSVIGAVAGAAGIVLSTACFAGGMAHGGGFHGAPMRMGGGGHGWGGNRGAHSLPPVSGVWHVRNGSDYLTRFGHTGTAFYGHGGRGFRAGVASGYGLHGGFYGHTGTAYGGTRSFGGRYARNFRYGGYGGRFPGYIGYGGYDADANAAPGYAEAPLNATYVEAPLAQGGGDGFLPSAAPVPGGNGGPQVIVLNGNDSGARHADACSCERPGASPVIYRYGVGSYY